MILLRCVTNYLPVISTGINVYRLTVSHLCSQSGMVRNIPRYLVITSFSGVFPGVFPGRAVTCVINQLRGWDTGITYEIFQVCHSN